MRPGRVGRLRPARQNLSEVASDSGALPPRDTTRSTAYVEYMLTTFLVIAGVLLGLVGLLALIVSLSARPATRPSGGWAADTPTPGPRR